MFISQKKEPLTRVELVTPSLPRMYSTTELQRLIFTKKRTFPTAGNKVRKNTLFFDSRLFFENFFYFIVTY